MGVINLKRVLLTIALVSILASSSVMSAAVRAISVTPTLTFTGTTAYCRVSITEIGKEIEATLELWHGTIDGVPFIGNSVTKTC